LAELSPSDLRAALVKRLQEHALGSPVLLRTQTAPRGVNSPVKAPAVANRWAAMRGVAEQRAVRRDALVDAIERNDAALNFVVKLYQRLATELSKVRSATTASRLTAAERRAAEGLLRLPSEPTLTTDFAALLALVGIAPVDDAERRCLLMDVFLHLRHVRQDRLRSHISALPALQPGFSPPRLQIDSVHAEKFAYIVGWVLFKLRVRVGTKTGPCASFIRCFASTEESAYDSVRVQRRTHIIAARPAVEFNMVVEALVQYLLDKYFESAGEEIFVYCKRSVLANNAVNAAWTALVRTSGVILTGDQRCILRFLWVGYYLKSRQKEYLRNNELLPKPVPTLRANLKAGKKKAPGAAKPAASASSTPATAASDEEMDCDQGDDDDDDLMLLFGDGAASMDWVADAGPSSN
jgi:hypothetical protein